MKTLMILLMFIAIEAKGQLSKNLVLIYDKGYNLYIDTTSISAIEDNGYSPRARFFVLRNKLTKDTMLDDIVEIYDGFLVPQAYHLFKHWDKREAYIQKLIEQDEKEAAAKAKEEKETKGNK